MREGSHAAPSAGGTVVVRDLTSFGRSTFFHAFVTAQRMPLRTNWHCIVALRQGAWEARRFLPDPVVRKIFHELDTLDFVTRERCEADSPPSFLYRRTMGLGDL